LAGVKTRAEPQRRCIVSGESGERAALIRFVVGPGDVIVPDIVGKLPGRGIWVGASAPLLSRAVEKRLFQRAARRPVKAGPELVGLVERLLVQQCQGLLGLARRAGELVTGFEKVRAFAAAGKAAMLVTARDGAPGGGAKLARVAAGVPVVALLDVAELSLALGRENVVHAALGPGGLANRFGAEARRLAGFRATQGPMEPPSAAGDGAT
jgi:uncharacterized protein